MKMLGADALARKLAKIAKAAKPRVEKAVAQNAADLARTAKVLIPRESGDSAGAITVRAAVDGIEVDFGPLARVIEGGRKPGVAKSGRAYGPAPAQPFVNPALTVTNKRRRMRVRRAFKTAIKEVLSGDG